MQKKSTIETYDAPKPIGPYSQAILTHQFLSCSGQIGMDPTSGDLVEKTAAEQAERAILNLRAVLRQAGLDLGDVVKVTLHLRSMDDSPQVNEVYARHFNQPKPSRTTIGAASLPKDSLVEIDAIAVTH